MCTVASLLPDFYLDVASLWSQIVCTLVLAQLLKQPLFCAYVLTRTDDAVPNLDGQLVDEIVHILLAEEGTSTCSL